MDRKNEINNFFVKPVVGTVLTVMAGLSFFFMCMIFPLVGPAGARVEHAQNNFAAFLAVLMLTSCLSGVATYLKLKRREIDQSPLPYWSIGLSTLCILIFVTLISGGFSI